MDCRPWPEAFHIANHRGVSESCSTKDSPAVLLKLRLAAGQIRAMRRVDNSAGRQSEKVMPKER